MGIIPNSQEAEKAFQYLKQAMALVMVLASPNFQQPFMIETNAL